MNGNQKPRLCIVGPLLGKNPGYITTQGVILSEKFNKGEYPVISVSAYPNRYMRLIDITSTLIRFRQSIDILILEVYSGYSFIIEDIASWLSKKFGHRVIMVLHGGILPQFMKRFPRWSQRVLQRADALIAPSEFLVCAIAAHGFRARVIPNVIDISRYPYRHRTALKPCLFWMRAFYDYYNPFMAVRVLTHLRSKFPEARLVMAGQDKGNEIEVKQLVKTLGLEEVVNFPGFLDMADKVREFEQADIYLNTNRIDNMPVAIVEAGAMGVPVVATAVGGIPNMLTDGETALLVPDDDDEAMANAVLRLLDDPDLARKLSIGGRRLAERSSWEQVHLQWQKVFTEVRA